MRRGTYRDREEAGRKLGAALRQREPRANPLVLGLPRGGMPVAAEVARALDADLDVLVVRKLGHPLQPELAFGAVATGGIRVSNPDVALALDPAQADAIAATAAAEVSRRSRMYRGEVPFLLAGRDVILVDDGLATGATMLAAVRAARAAEARTVTVAVPVGDADVCGRIGREADEVVCLLNPPALMAVGMWYENFPQLTDYQVVKLLGEARHPGAGARSGPQDTGAKGAGE